MTIETKTTGKRLTVTVNGKKTAIGKAVEQAFAASKTEDIVLSDGNKNFTFNEDAFMLGAYNLKVAIQQFAKGERVTGAIVLNNSEIGTYKPAFDAQRFAEPVTFEARLAELNEAKDRARAIWDEKEAILKAARVEAEKAWSDYDNTKAAITRMFETEAERLTKELRAVSYQQPEGVHMKTTMLDGNDGYIARDMQVVVHEDNDFNNCFLITNHDVYYSRRIARYQTPAQVEEVINRLKAAIERGDERFTFPTVDELNAI